VKVVSSDALGVVNKALGIAGQGARITEFPDGELVQVIDVTSPIRRGRTLAGTTGMFHAGFRNEHAGAGDLTNQIDVYNAGATVSVAPYPPVMPDYFDVWLLSAMLRRISGTGTIAATLGFQWGTGVAFGRADDGTLQLPSDQMVLAWWDGTATAINVFGTQNDANPWQKIGIRIPRTAGGAAQLFFITTASAASDWECEMLLGVFPVSLGQDALI